MRLLLVVGDVGSSMLCGHLLSLGLLSVAPSLLAEPLVAKAGCQLHNLQHR